MKLPLIGPAYESPYNEVNLQRCVNLFTSSSGPSGRGDQVDGKGAAVLVPTAGLEVLTDLTGSEMRSIQTFGAFTYVVVDDTVYKLTIDEDAETAISENIGTITTSSTGAVSVAVNPTQIVWVDGTATGYIYTPGTDTFATINSLDADFTGGDNIVFLDSYFIVNAPGTGQIYTSASNDGTDWDPLDVATAESSTDNIVALEISKGELWVLGEKTTEIWYNAGNATGSPLSPRDGLEMQIGCGAADSVVQLDDLIIWLDNRGYIVQSNVSPLVRDNNSGYDLQVISTEAITTEILGYSTRSDAVACAYNDRGHLMYQITFPTAKKTWVYDYTMKMWHERTWLNTVSSESEHHLVQFTDTFEQLQLGGGIRSGKVYLMKPDVYTEDSDTVERIRTTAPAYEPNEYGLIGIDNLSIRVSTGAATQSGGGSDPEIIMRYSNDGGYNWSATVSQDLARSMGNSGEYAKRIDWNRLGHGREWVFEFTVSEPISFAIVDAKIEVADAPE